MITVEYDRNAAVEYAKKWAFRRNPLFYDFSNIGGDCTNFASQCIYYGSGIMNFTPLYGWYYLTANDRTPSWTGVEYLYDFLIGNSGLGPFGKECNQDELELGDIVQLGDLNGHFYHAPIVVGLKNGDVLLAAHSSDEYMRPLNDYYFSKVRFIHIEGVRKP